jgi:uncharacterized membrane protein YgcG
MPFCFSGVFIMSNKPASRNWGDIQLVIATGSMALTLALWNMFAGPDREVAMKHSQEKAAIPPQPVQSVAPAPALQAPVIPTGPILLGGSAPQTTIVVQKSRGGGGDTGGASGGGGGGGGGAVTSTGSS